METKTIATLSRTATVASATDNLVLDKSGEDYKIPVSIFSQSVIQEIFSNYNLTLAAKNISAGTQFTDLSSYESGGTSEKMNGFRIKVQWTGGAGTFFHLWTGTTYTIDGMAIADFICAGTGFVILELDKTNGNWVLAQDGRELAGATYLTPNTTSALQPITFATKVLDPYGMYSAGNFTIPKSGWYITQQIITPNGAGNFKLYKGSSPSLYRTGAAASINDVQVGFLEYLVKGDIISIRHDSAIGTYATGRWFSICEQRRG